MWMATMMGYLWGISSIDLTIYGFLKDKHHLLIALDEDFENDHMYREKLVHHICVGYNEALEDLTSDDSSMAKLLGGQRLSDMKDIIIFFEPSLQANAKTSSEKILPLWTRIFEVLFTKLQNTSIEHEKRECKILLSKLLFFIGSIDHLNSDVYELAKKSVPYLNNTQDHIDIPQVLYQHVDESPEYVGNLYVDVLSYNVLHPHKKEIIIELVKKLYTSGFHKPASQICNIYREKGFDFLKSTYEQFDPGYLGQRENR